MPINRHTDNMDCIFNDEGFDCIKYDSCIFEIRVINLPIK